MTRVRPLRQRARCKLDIGYRIASDHGRPSMLDFYLSWYQKIQNGIVACQKVQNDYQKDRAFALIRGFEGVVVVRVQRTFSDSNKDLPCVRFR